MSDSKKFMVFVYLMIINLCFAGYSQNFVGVSFESFWDLRDFQNVGLSRFHVVYTWGKASMKFTRFRVGGGFYKDSFFPYILIGAEIRFLEILSPYKSRFFGLYVIPDLIIGQNFQMSISGGILLPLTVIGGMFVGANYSVPDNEFTLLLSYMTGVYPLEKK